MYSSEVCVRFVSVFVGSWWFLAASTNLAFDCEARKLFSCFLFSCVLRFGLNAYLTLFLSRGELISHNIKEWFPCGPFLVPCLVDIHCVLKHEAQLIRTIVCRDTMFGPFVVASCM